MYVKDRLRRSMMFVPGNNPGMIRDAHIYGADSIMFDLEDSVAYTEKDTARFLVYNALKTLHFGSKETVVRINDLSSGLGIKDLEAVVRAGVQVVRLPKTDSAQDVIDCEREIQRIERESGIPVGTTGMMAAIESANGVLHAAEIAHASGRLIGIALGAEDYVTDLKTTRSDGIELLFARCMILNAARSAGIAALDTVYSDVNNEEGFIAEATLIKKLGFDGKSVISPRQIEREGPEQGPGHYGRHRRGQRPGQRRGQPQGQDDRQARGHPGPPPAGPVRGRLQDRRSGGDLT